MQRLLTFLFGSAPVWERRLIIGRMIAIALAIALLAFLLSSEYKGYVGLVFWLCMAGIVGSFAYQYIRRRKELRSKEHP